MSGVMGKDSADFGPARFISADSGPARFISADFGPARFISDLCRTDELDPFPVWVNGTVSPCFDRLVLGALPHALLAVLSACYLSAPRRESWRSRRPARGWAVRLACALLLDLLFAADVVMATLLPPRPPPGDLYLSVLCDGCAALGWLVHGAALLAMRGSVCGGGSRGPAALALLVVLTVPGGVVGLVACVRDAAGDLDLLGEPIRATRWALTAARPLPLLVYLLAFAFPCVSSPSPSPPSSPSPPDGGGTVAEDGSSLASRLLYLWLTPLLARGRRGELERPGDVFLLPAALRVHAARRRFRRCWEDCRRRGAGPGAGPGEGAGPGTDQERLLEREAAEEEEEEEVRLWTVLHRAFGRRFYALGALKLVGNALGFAGPLLLSGLVGFMEEEEEEGGAPGSVGRGAWFAFGLFASALLSAFVRNVFVFEVSKVALSARAALVCAVYGKALRVGGGQLASRFALGEVVNLMSTDADRVVNFFSSFHEAWSLPVQFCVALYLLYLQVGVACLGGLGVALLLVPLNKLLAACILDHNKSMLTHKDRRVKLMAEVLFGIRVVKLHSWEPHFAQKIAESRRRELAHLQALKYLDAVCVYTWAALPVVISILTFLTYVLLGHELTAAKVFTTLALVGMLILPLNSFPWVLSGVLEAKVSLDRIQRFLQLSDLDLHAYYSPDPPLTEAPEAPQTSMEVDQAPQTSVAVDQAPEAPQTSVAVDRGSFSWQSPAGPDHAPETQRDEAGSSSTRTKGSLLLHNINLRITKGALVVVVGQVGCGKSSLLAAITGELTRCGGAVYVRGREHGFGLASQEPWIQHATLRENILFGSSYDRASYQAVIQACELTEDLNMLPRGDRTEVGENGVTLSGGQKARLALARAVYMDKDVYLLDDPLAAVDADVAHQLMEKCILGILRSKTRILCTHRTEFVDQADVVVLMDNGTIIKTGTPAEVLPLVEAGPKQQRSSRTKQRGTEVTERVEEQEQEEEQEEEEAVCSELEEEEEEEEEQVTELEEELVEEQELEEEQACLSSEEQKQAGQLSSEEQKQAGQLSSEEQKQAGQLSSEEQKQAGQLSSEEQKQAGQLSWRVYQAYWRAVGGALASCVLLSLLLMQASKNVSDWWLSHWISSLKNNGSTLTLENHGSTPSLENHGSTPSLENHGSTPSLENHGSTPSLATAAGASPYLLLFSPGQLMFPVFSRSVSNVSSEVRFYLTVYASIAAGNTVLTAARAFLFAYGAVRAATAVHRRLLDRVLTATVAFFDGAPVGRVLNRFSSDLSSVDDALPFSLNILLANAFSLLGTLVVMSYGLPWVLVLVAPLALLYQRTQSFYRHAARDLKRLGSLTLSPLYTHFSETLSGIWTIRASRSTARFEQENERHLDLNQRCLFLSNSAMQWLDIRLQMIGVAVVTGIAVIAVVQHQLKSVDPGLVGLALSYALSITGLLSGLIFSFTQTEMQLVSVERTEEYSTSLPSEPQHGDLQVPPAWPEQGRVEFRGAVLRYREGLPNALDGLSLEVRPGEKVGIVGRTGAGKSSLFSALFRTAELSHGLILLDGLDIRRVGLAQLRSRLAIIPQDPFLFSGTLRENLDPRGRHPDQRLERALEHSHLSQAVSRMGLERALEQSHLRQAVSRMGGLDAEVGERGRSLSVGQRQLLCLARALLTDANILCIDEATASVDQKTDALLQQMIRDNFRDKTVLTIAHRTNTIMDSDRVLVVSAGRALEFDTPQALLQRHDSAFLQLLGGTGQDRTVSRRSSADVRQKDMSMDQM